MVSGANRVFIDTSYGLVSSAIEQYPRQNMRKLILIAVAAMALSSCGQTWKTDYSDERTVKVSPGGYWKY